MTPGFKVFLACVALILLPGVVAAITSDPYVVGIVIACAFLLLLLLFGAIVYLGSTT